MNPQRKAVMLALTAILFWSTMGSAFKLSLGYLHFTDLLLWSSGISLVVLALILSVQGQWHKVAGANRKEWLSSAFLGLLNPFGYYIILFKAYSLIPAQEAVALNYTWPVILVLLSIPFLGQRIRLTSILAILVSFSGALLVVSKGDLTFLSVAHPVGSLLAGGSSLIWATFWLLNVRDGRSEEVKLFMNFVMGFLYTLVVFLLSGEPAGFRGPGIMGSIYIGIFEMGLTFFIWLKALQTASDTARVTKLVYISPFISLILIHFLVGERIHNTTWGGLALIIGGIVLESALRRKKRSEPTQDKYA